MLEVDLTDHALYVNGFPHDLFTELRRQSPIVRHKQTILPDRVARGQTDEFWVLLSHPLVQRANRDWETFSALAGPSILASIPENQGHSLVASDPPEHTRLRRLISAGFTPRMIARLDESILEYTTRILDEVIERGGEIDFVRDVAYLLPMQIIAEIMGIPDADRAAIFGHIDTFLRATDPKNDLTADDYQNAMTRLYEYARALGEEKRRRPTEDVWSTLALAQIEHEDGEAGALTLNELDLFFLILSVAGSETTRNAISAGMTALIEHPDQFERLRSEPGLIDSATDEIIRWASPITMFARQATRDVELGGVEIKTGERVSMWYPSANRDDDVFADPFRFDIGRQPNPHVAFGGGGVHYCLGAHLAKREVHVMFEQIARRFSGAEITGPAVFCTPNDVIAASADHLPTRMTPG